MKKLLALVLAIVMVLSLCACTKPGNPNTGDNSNNNSTGNNNSNNNGNGENDEKDEKVTASLLTKVVITNNYEDSKEIMTGVMEYDADYNVIGSKAYLDDKLYNELTFAKDPNRPLVEQYYDEDGNPGERAVYTYDEDGNQLTHTSFNEDGEVDWKYVYTYDKDGNQLSKKSYSGDELEYEIVYTYDEHGNMLSETNEIGDWCNTFENTYKDGKLTQVKRYTDGTLSGCTQYDGDGNEILSISYDDEEESERTESTYENGKLIKVVSYTYGDESYCGEYTYNEDGKLTQQLRKYSDEYVFKTINTYNDNGDLIGIVNYDNEKVVAEITLSYKTVTVSKEQAEGILNVQDMLGI